jgi:hypothetical protein
MSGTGDHALDWHSLIGPDNAMTAQLGDYQATVEQMAAFGPEKFEWRIARSASAVDVHAPGFSNAIFEPVAEGRAPTLAEGLARAEEAAAALVIEAPTPMSPEESAAYMAAHPEFAAKVAVHARELAMERGIITRWPGIDPACDLGWRRVPMHQTLEAVAGDYEVAVRSREPYAWSVLRRSEVTPFDDDQPYVAQGTAASFEDGMRAIASALDDLGVTPAQLKAAEGSASPSVGTGTEPTTVVGRAFPAGPMSGDMTMRAASPQDFGAARFQPGRGR